jgi:hypothetical protein
MMDATAHCNISKVISPYLVLRLTSDHSYSTGDCVSTLISKGSDHRKKDIGQDQGRPSEGCIALAQRLRSPAANCRDSGHNSRMRVQH